jgi:hypothetical protein
MRIISTRAHGVLDYLMGALLILSPWLLGFAAGGAETWVPVVLGASTIVYSLMTNYELGVVGVLPMPVHLGLDAAAGIFLAFSPWLFGFAGLVWVPHVVLGVLEVGAAAMTQPLPVGTAARTPAARH